MFTFCRRWYSKSLNVSQPAHSSKLAAAAAASSDAADAEVEVEGERTWAERDAELRAKAVAVDDCCD